MFLKVILLMLLSFNSYAYQVFDTVAQKFIEKNKFLDYVSTSENFVIGEFHYDIDISQTEANLIKDIVNKKNMAGHFSVAWEFLNFPKQEKLFEMMLSYKSNEIEALEIIKEFFPGKNNTKMHSVYIPLFKLVKDLNGQFIATNAPRDWKKVITSKGIDFLSSEKVPANMSLGSKEYFARFNDVMSGHVTPEQLKKYFVAQSYTDSVISTSISNITMNKLNFLVIGSFHSDFNDGVVKKMDAIMGGNSITLKVVNPVEIDTETLKLYLKGSDSYGAYSRFIILTN